jgi:Ca2+-binding EF-hand superfamily protein
VEILIVVLPVAGSGELEFEEFVTLSARFLVEEDAEAMQQELREAFRLYDKEGKLSDDNFHNHI